MPAIFVKEPMILWFPARRTPPKAVRGVTVEPAAPAADGRQQPECGSVGMVGALEHSV